MPSFLYEGLYSDESAFGVRGACSGLTAAWIASSQTAGRAMRAEDFHVKFEALGCAESRYFREGVIEGTFCAAHRDGASSVEVASLGRIASIYRSIMFGRLNIVFIASDRGTFPHNLTWAISKMPGLFSIDYRNDHTWHTMGLRLQEPATFQLFDPDPQRGLYQFDKLDELVSELRILVPNDTQPDCEVYQFGFQR
jgi:hypothetical protein